MKKIIILSTLLLTSLSLITGCTSKTADNEPDTSSSSLAVKTEEIQVTVTVIAEDKEVASQELTLAKGENLMAALKANFKIKEEGGMLTSVEGIDQKTDDGFYWTYTINEEMVNTGAEETIMNEGDKVVLSYAKF